MKRTIAVLISAVLFSGILVLGAMPTVQAEPGCSLATLNGTFGGSLTWFTQGTGATAATVASLPAAQVGIITFDGAGTFSSGFNTQSNNGAIFSFYPAGGTYTVNPDCTASGVATNGQTITFLILDKGRKALFIPTLNPFFPGWVITSGVAIRTGDLLCSPATLQGTFGFSGAGFFQGTGAATAKSASLPHYIAGIITADGAGGFSQKSTESDNGTINAITTSGTYTVNANCTGSATTVDGRTVNFVIVSEGNELIAISTIPGDVTTLVAFKMGD